MSAHNRIWIEFIYVFARARTHVVPMPIDRAFFISRFVFPVVSSLYENIILAYELKRALEFHEVQARARARTVSVFASSLNFVSVIIYRGRNYSTRTGKTENKKLGMLDLYPFGPLDTVAR